MVGCEATPFAFLFTREERSVFRQPLAWVTVVEVAFHLSLLLFRCTNTIIHIKLSTHSHASALNLSHAEELCVLRWPENYLSGRDQTNC